MITPASISFRFIGGDGREYGPVDLATLQQWTREGRVARAVRVWDSRAGNWLLAEQIAELAPFFGVASAATPPPVVPVPPPVAPRTNTLAVWSFSLALIGLYCCGCPSIPAIVLGAVSLAQIDTRRECGRGLAIAGIVIGVAAIVLGCLGGLLWSLLSSHGASSRGTFHFL